MSRPKPNVILEHVNNDNYKSEQVLEAEAIWAVFYQENGIIHRFVFRCLPSFPSTVGGDDVCSSTGMLLFPNRHIGAAIGEIWVSLCRCPGLRNQSHSILRNEFSF